MTFRFASGALAAALTVAVGAAPSHRARAQAVVQPVPPAALGDLQEALRVLARNPQDLSALLRAAWASLELDDTQAALGYFRRAEAIAPASGEVSAGYATMKLRQGDPVEAVRLFAQAETQGADMTRLAGDRGLALDLVGNNVAAQQYYRKALQRRSDPEIVRRLALSQAIGGDQRASEATLLPLLQRSDLAAYRSRAFALAILGRSDEAISIAQTMLPATLSNRMAPYLRYMPRLTRAQQAAAANLGQFPPASEIGRDRPEIAAISGQQETQQVAARAPDSRLEPSGKPLGASESRARQTRSPSSSRRRERQEGVVVGRVVEATSTPIESPRAATGELPPLAAPGISQAPKPEPQPVVVAAQAQAAPGPSFSVSPPAATGADLGAAPLTEAFADFSLPPGGAASPANGAVDITAFEPPREKAEEPAPPTPPEHPARHWVQLATGRDVEALAFDWRRIKRSGGDLLVGSEGFTVSWGQTNRLVTGPYPTAAAAQQAVTELKAKGLDTFAFTSEAGEAVSPLS